MNALKREELDNKLRIASPLELVSVLQEVELYDAKSTRLVVDEIYQEFQSGESLQKQILIPVFTSIADGFLECSAATRKLRRKGLTATRLVSECRKFTYDNQNLGTTTLDGYMEYKNARDYYKKDSDAFLASEAEKGNKSRIVYDRKVYDDDSKKYYKERAVAANNGRKNLLDEYTGERNITAYQNNSDGRRNDPTHRYQAQADHIIPLADIHKQLSSNYALFDEDIVRIANSDDNLALTAAYINQGIKGKGGKKDLTNEEFVKDQKKRKQEGRDNLELSDATEINMIKKAKEAQLLVDNQVNKAVFANIIGKGVGEHTLEFKRIEKELGRKLTQDEKLALDKELQSAKQKEILGNTSKNAFSQNKDYFVGNVILFLIKPLYYEISDIVRNGLQNGVNATSVGQAFKIRFGRVKDYVLTNAMAFMGNSVWDFVKGFVSSLIEGFISLFVGVFKQILKLMKEGIRILIQSGKVLFGKESALMSSTEKGDAIIKIIGGGVISICGIGLEALMNKLGIPEPWSVVLSTIGAGIASVLFMMMLDKMDLFSVKAEKRQKRIDDIFSERINDIKLAAQTLNTAAMETLRTQYLQYSSIKEEIMEGVRTNSIDAINDYANKLAEFFKVELPYKTTEEFVVYMNSKDSIEL